MKNGVSGQSPEELSTLLAEMGEKPFRGKQVFEFIHRNLAGSFEEMTTLSKALRDRLEETLGPVRSLTEVARATSQDGTIKLALATMDGEVIETVLIPMESGTFTQCISSQVGCAMGCRFCMTAQLGFRRNLTASEIVDQHHLARIVAGEGRIRNLVYMGMGEPLLNVDNVKQSVALLQHPRGCDFSRRRITLSTCGVIPGIERMATEIDAHLAISLNAPNQELRADLMPVSKKYPLEQLMETLKKFPLAPRQRLTFEYVLLKGVNDSPEHARQLVRLLSHIPNKINVIPFNPFPSAPFEGPTEEGIATFVDVLSKRNVTVTVRRSRGSDIEAACGQLAGKVGDSRKPTDNPGQ